MRKLALLVAVSALVLGGRLALETGGAPVPASVAATPEPSMSATPDGTPSPPSAPTAAAPTSDIPFSISQIQIAAGSTTASTCPQGRVALIDVTSAPRQATPPAIVGGSTPSAQQLVQVKVVQLGAADNGKTVQMASNQPIILELGTDVDWTVSEQPADLLCPVPGSESASLPAGIQAVLYANKSGTATVVADGRPKCAPGQPCRQSVQRFSATVVIAAASATAQPSGASATSSSGPMRLPNTGRHASDDRFLALLAAASGLIVVAAIGARWARHLTPGPFHPNA